MGKLVLLRHGQSEWNKKNIFTGWIDIPLSAAGIVEAQQAGRQLAALPIDCVFTSELQRAVTTALIALSVHGSGRVAVMQHAQDKDHVGWAQCHSEETAHMLIPVQQAWQLNERMYGELQGKNKQQMRAQYGEEQVQLWRRSYAIPPPGGESLKMTAERTLPYFKQAIEPRLKAGETVLIVAHGNSLRALVMELEGLSGDAVVGVEIPTGKPLFYDWK